VDEIGAAMVVCEDGIKGESNGIYWMLTKCPDVCESFYAHSRRRRYALTRHSSLTPRTLRTHDSPTSAARLETSSSLMSYCLTLPARTSDTTRGSSPIRTSVSRGISTLTAQMETTQVLDLVAVHTVHSRLPRSDPIRTSDPPSHESSLHP
jgi:hypothetical protein